MKKPAKQSLREAEQTDYRAWRVEAAAELANRHAVAPGTVPERLWRHMYIRGMTPQKAADQAAASAYNAMSPADRLKRLKR
jgi:hypothetical protein